MAELCIRGVRLRVSFGFLIVLALLSCTEHTFSFYFLACLVHELGHLFCMTLFCVRPSEIRFSAGGILIVPVRDRLLPVRTEVMILLSGAGVNLFLAALLFRLGMMESASVQLFVGVWNLLPSASLDGGAIVWCIADHLCCTRWAPRLLAVLSGAALLLLALFCHSAHIGGGLLCAVLIWLGGTELAKGVGM